MNNRELGLVCNFRLRMTQEWQARISVASKNMFYITFSSALKTQQCPLEQKNAVLKQNVARDISVCLYLLDVTYIYLHVHISLVWMAVAAQSLLLEP